MIIFKFFGILFHCSISDRLIQSWWRKWLLDFLINLTFIFDEENGLINETDNEMVIFCRGLSANVHVTLSLQWWGSVFIHPFCSSLYDGNSFNYYVHFILSFKLLEVPLIKRHSFVYYIKFIPNTMSLFFLFLLLQTHAVFICDCHQSWNPSNPK